MAPGIGELFRQRREQAGKTLAQAAAETKISPRMLQAIEEERFDRIPSLVYARSFILSYAQNLGLDPQEVWGRYRAAVAAHYEEPPVSGEANAVPVNQGNRAQRQPDPTPRYRLVTAAVAAGALALAALIVYEGTSSVTEVLEPPEWTDGRPAARPSNLEGPSASAALKARPLDTGQLEMSVNEPAPEVSSFETEPSEPSEDLVLEIEATEESWIVAQIDDRQVKEVLLRPGDRVRWKARERFVLTVGNAGGVILEYNGEVLESLGPSGKVVRDFVLTR